MSKIAVIRIAFAKQVSDGNYGSETARCELELTADEADHIGSVESAQLLGLARQRVEGELGLSPNANVRRAVEPPVTQVATDAVDEDLPF